MKWHRFTAGAPDGTSVQGGPHQDLQSASASPSQGKLPLEPTPDELAGLTLQAALEKHKKRVADHPASAWAWYQYGDTLLSLKRPAEAVPALSKAVELSPETALYHYDLGLALFDLEQNTAAIEKFAAIVAGDPHLKCGGSTLVLSAMTNLALCREKLGRRDEAVETLLPALDTAVGILFNLGFLHFRAGRFEAALPYARAAYLLRPNNEDVVHQYGSVLLETQRLRDASKILREAVALNPDCCGAWYDLGLAYARQKLLKKARGYFLRAQKVDPGRPWPYYDLACLDALEGRREEAFRNLWLALDRGFRNAAHLRRDRDLRSLRRDKRMKRLLDTIDRLEISRN